MLSKIKQTIKHTSIFALGKVSSKLIGFILLPIYTKEISVSDYGILGILEIIDLLGSSVLSIGMPQALLRWYSLADQEIDRKRIAFTNFIFLTFIFLTATIAISFIKSPLSDLLFNDPKYGIFIFYVLISVTFSNLASVPQTILRIEEKSVLYTSTLISQFTISLILNIYFVAIKKLGVEGILIANILSNSALFMILFPYLTRKIKPQLDLKKLKEMIAFSYPFIFIAFATTVLSIGDRYILTKLSSLTQTGIYSLGFKISNVLKIFVVESFILGLPIIAWQVVKENTQPKIYLSKIFTYLAFVLLWFGLAITIYSKGIIHVFALNKDYWDAYRVVPYLILGVVFLGLQQHLFFILQIPKKTKQISIIVGIAAVSNVIINLILIPHFQMMGAAYTTVISYFLATLLAYFTVRKYYPVKFEGRRLAILFGVAFLFYFISTLIGQIQGISSIVLKGVLLISFPFTLFFFNFYDVEELNKIRELIKKFLRRKN